MIVTEQPLQKAAPRARRGRATLAIHGGAGGTLPPHIPPSMEAAYRDALRKSLITGYTILSDGGSALDAVCRSVQVMEDDPLFNAGKGAVFTRNGTNECESSVMFVAPPRQAQDTQAQLQRNRRCASAILIKNTRNPILLAKALLMNAQENPHVILSGRQAEELGWELGCERVDSSYYYTRRRWLEHRRDLGLPDDCDPGTCSEEHQKTEEPASLDPPPSYYAISETDATPSLDDSDLYEKETERSTTTEAHTPSCESREIDLGIQRFTHWHLDFDARQQQEMREDDESMQSSRHSRNWRSDSFEELSLPTRGSSISLPRRRASTSTRSLSIESLPAGTVGAVALDEHGNLAVATSTGGVTNKLPGRIGDTPTPGAGFWSEYWRIDSAPPRYKATSMPVSKSKEDLVDENRGEGEAKANSSCRHPCEWARRMFGLGSKHEDQQDEEDAIEQASNPKSCQAAAKDKVSAQMISGTRDFRGVAVSGTGTGDYFLRSSFASLLVHRMRFLGEGVDVAGRKAVAEMGAIGGVGGAICIDEGGQGESHTSIAGCSTLTHPVSLQSHSR